jgi:hypothetical protein
MSHNATGSFVNSSEIDLTTGSSFNYTLGAGTTTPGGFGVYIYLFDLSGRSSSDLEIINVLDDTAPQISNIVYTPNTTDTIVDTDFYYISLGYEQFTGSQSGTFLPLTVIGSRKDPGVVGWQVGGNSGADGGGLLASGEIWGGTLSNGFTTYAFYRQTYNAGDPSHCNLIILLGHQNWASQFGSINSYADPVNQGGNGAYYYTSSTASNILAIHTLLSKNSGQLVTANECRTVVNNFTLRIKQALGF